MLLLQNIVTFFSILFSGLVAGLLYSYSTSVNLGLKALEDKEYLSAMQSINRAIQNPLFFLSFMGLLILLPILCWFAFKGQVSISFSFALAATFIYFLGVFGVTVVGNIPLNNKLEQFSIAASSLNEMKAMRNSFEAAWVRWHTIRTIASIVSFGMLLVGLMKKL